MNHLYNNEGTMRCFFIFQWIDTIYLKYYLASASDAADITLGEEYNKYQRDAMYDDHR